MRRLKIYFGIMCVGISIFLFGCTYSSKSPLELSFNEIYVQVAETVKLDVSSSSDDAITFESSDPKIATVTSDGLITGVAEGQTKIKVMQGNYYQNCIVNVGIQEPTKIYILSYDDLDLTYGDGSVNFKVIFDSIVSSNVSCDWYLNDTLIEEAKNEIDFIPNTAGDYEIYAKYKNVQSNTLHFSVKKAQINVTANDISIPYLEEEQDLTYQITSGELCYNDAFIGQLTREEGNNAGIYKISQGSLSIADSNGKNVIDNYEFTFSNGKYIIEKIAQTEIKNEDISIDVTSTTLTINSEVPNLEYSLDSEVWQDSNTFENLNPDSDYLVFVRIKETINYISSGVLELNSHTLKQYKINMYSINGNPTNEEYVIYETLIYDEGATVDLVLHYPDVTGYTFKNYRFILNNEDITNQDEIHIDSLKQDINVFAIYEINIYEVTFVSFDKEEKYSFKYLDQISFPSANERVGYVFTNWINEDDIIIDDTFLVIDNMTITAQYEMKNFVVAFYNSSQMIYSEVVAAYASLTDIPENPTQEGYNFIGWNTKLDGSGTYYYTLSDLAKIKDDLYLFAVYEIMQYKVTYLDYDGTLLYEEMVDYGSRALYDQIPKRDGYIFIGWSASLDKVTGNIEVSAQYQKIENSEEEI